MKVMVKSSLSLEKLSSISVANLVYKKLGVHPEIVIWNTVLWANAVHQNRPYCLNSPRTVWFLHEWSIVKEEPELNTNGEKNWYGREFKVIEAGPQLWKTVQGADAIVFVAEAQRRLWHDVDGIVPTFVIPGTIKGRVKETTDPASNLTRLSMGISSNSFVMTMVGTIASRKRQLWGIEALKCLQMRGVNATLLIIGPQPKVTRKYYRAVVKAAEPLGSSVRLIPGTQDVTPYIRMANLHLSASAQEVFPLNTLEAMAESVPVIATKAGGQGEQFVHKETQWMLVDQQMESFVAAVARAAELETSTLKSISHLQSKVPKIVAKKFEKGLYSLLDAVHHRRESLLDCGMMSGLENC